MAGPSSNDILTSDKIKTDKAIRYRKNIITNKPLNGYISKKLISYLFVFNLVAKMI